MMRAYEVAVPAEVTDLTLLDRVDHQDAYAVDTAVDRVPREWMSQFLEGSPRWFHVPWLRAVAALGADVGPLHSPRHILRFPILADRPDVFVVGISATAGLEVRLATVAEPGRGVFATQVRIDNRRVSALWAGVRPAHRFFAAYLLARAAAALEQQPAGLAATPSGDRS